MVMFIYRPEYHGIENNEMGQAFSGETHINIAKHRNGKLDTVKLKAVLEYQKFVEVEVAGEWSGGGDAAFGRPDAGFPQHYQDSGDPTLSIATDFQTKPSKMNSYDWDDEDEFKPKKNRNNPPSPEDDAPF